MPTLPIEPLIPQIQARLKHHPALVLQAPPGAGKTTLVPLALLDQPWLAGRRILMLEPRRLAARAAAVRMAELLGEPLGQGVGYQIRFERRISERTRIEVLTEGILTRRLQNDPALDGVGLVIFDEFHERSLHADLALALCKESRDALREDLRLLIMSATLDGEAVARLLDDAPMLTSSGRNHPVTLHYLDRESDDPMEVVTTRAVLHALTEHSGDILVFLPGGGEIRRTLSRLSTYPACAKVRLLPLYGDLPQAEQLQALRPDPQGLRKVVLATPIAETSLTIEGISIVVDAGWARTPRFEPRRGLTRMNTVRISQDSAEQRTGRAGRLGPGVCYRLWSKATQRGLRPQRIPEMLEADLAPLALELAQWGVNDAGELAWLDPPPSGALAQASDLLRDLEALDQDNRITDQGRQLAGLGLHPRLAHMLLRGASLGLGQLACDLAALLDQRDILDRTAGCDLRLRLEVLEEYRRQGRQGARRLGADPAACAQVERTARQWWNRLKRGIQPSGRRQPENAATLGLLLAMAYPDRIACRRDNSMERYKLAGGRGARLRADDALVGQDWLVAAHLDAGSEEGCIFLAATLDPTDLEIHLLRRIREIRSIAWEPRRQAVLARQERRFGELLLDSRAVQDADPQALRIAMLEGIRQLGLNCLPWTRELRGWQARVLSLRVWCPEQAWPDLSDVALESTLEQWLEPWLDGITRRDHLQRLDLTAILKALLDWPRQQQLERLAPSHLRVPSGSRLRLDYSPDAEPPVLAVKLQEMFGLTDTPRVADGRVPVILHLLSPARRAIQVTQDLRNFWEYTYQEVKKELKGRYPKHAWPDDPHRAAPGR